MYREKIEKLKKWKESPNRKPLIIRGARQVGKTWLMKEFGKKYYDKCAYINFDDNSRMNKLFEEDFVNDIFDQKKIIKLLDDNYNGDGSHRRQIWAIYTFLVWYKLFFVDYKGTVEKYQHVQPEVDALIKQGKLL